MAEPDSLLDLTGKTAIVTGASRGIGEAIARRLAQYGANVVVSSRKIDACDAVVRSINMLEGRETAFAIPCNITHKEELQRLVDETKAKVGPVDILVANAAVNPYFGPASEMTDEQFDKVIDCNVKSPHWLSQMVLPDMRAKKDGSIIIISSIGGFIGSASLGAYSISKAADLQLARNLAVEVGPDNVRVNCICPGVVKTQFAEALWKDPKIEKVMTERLPLRRFGEPDDIAGAAVFLASPAARWMTGQAMIIDGGAMISLGEL